MSELKPCLCGSEAELRQGTHNGIDGFYVQCKSCRMKTELAKRYQVALFRWNRRTQTTDKTACKFCGGKGQIRHKMYDGHDSVYILCESCYNKTDLYPTEKKAIEKWEDNHV